MEREIDDRTILDKFVEDFCEIIDKHVKYLVCSGFVVIAHGRSRGTEDIDMIIEKLSKEDFMKMHDDLIKGGFVCMQDLDSASIYENYLIVGDSIRYVFDSDGLFPPEMEVKFVKDILDEEQMKTRKKFPLTGVDVYFSSIEYNIAFKEELLKTPKDLEDAKHLRLIYENEISEEEISKIKQLIKKLRMKEK